MKLLCILMALSASAALAGTGVVGADRDLGLNECECFRLPRVPQPVMQSIKDLAVRVHPTHPADQLVAITEGVCAYLSLQQVPETPEKAEAARLYPGNYPKQLYLAQRPLQN